ncbi:MAG: BolA family protein [Pseudomonadota bacterium]
MNAERIERMKALLQEALTVDSLEIIDDSHKHAGHAGAKDGHGHFTLKITATEFDGLTTIKRHRLIYEVLGDMMKTDIHALRILATPPAD